MHGGADYYRENISVVPDFVYMTQEALELNIGGAVEYSLPDNENPATLLKRGVIIEIKMHYLYRGVGYKNMKLGLCYDFNTSDLSVASANKGGFNYPSLVCFITNYQLLWLSHVGPLKNEDKKMRFSYILITIFGRHA